MLPHSRYSLLVAFVLLLTVRATVALDCVWLYSAYEGIPLTATLGAQWNCSGTLGITTTSPILAGFSIPNVRIPTFVYTPPLGGTALGQQSQSLSVTCNVFSKGCDTATVYFVVRPSSLTTPAPPTTTPAPPTTTTAAPTPVPTLAPGQTRAPTTPTPPTTTTAAPTTPVPTPAVPVVCANPSSVITTLQTPTAIAVMRYVTGCVAPQLQLTSNSTLFSLGSDGVSVTFDANGTNTVQGVFTAVFNVQCGGALVCILTQYVVASAPIATTTLPPPTPSPTLYAMCVPVYGYDCYFGTTMNFSLAGLDGASVCPAGTNITTYQLLSNPRLNAQNFTFSFATGNFVYVAPTVVSADGFTFNIVCDQVVLCSATAYLITTSSSPAPTTATPPTTPTQPQTAAPSTTPAPTVAPMPSCVGSFAFLFYRDATGSLPPQQGNLFTALTQNFSTSCTAFSGLTIVTNAKYGLVTITDSVNGIFQYAVAAGSSGPTDWDNFTATISCASPIAQTCLATVSILVLTPSAGPTPAPTPVPTLAPPVYRISDTLMCSGTCSANAWKSIDTNKDGFDVNSNITTSNGGIAADAVEFYLGGDSKLYLVAFTTIGNMAARFPTFVPVQSTTQLTSAAAVGRGTAFDPMCLDKQGKYGVGYALWNWTNTTTLQGYAIGNYASGKDYYQHFGGKHNDCDTFRNGACQYAPLLNPSNQSGIAWRLYVNDCSAIWVGTASLTDIRSLRFSNGSSIFKLGADGKTLRGTIYSEVMKPRSWVRPSDGTLQLAKAYDVTMYIRNLLTMNTTTIAYVPIVTTTTAAGNGSTDANATTTASLPPTTATPTTTTLAPTSTVSQNASITSNGSTTSPNATLQSDAATTAAPATAVSPPAAPQLPLYTASVNFATDISYSVDADLVTAERLYRYNVMLYPTNYSVTIPNATIFDQLYVVNVRLGSASFITPRLADCPQCTGNLTACSGVNNSFTDSCGAAAMVSFTPFSGVYLSPCASASTFPAVPGVSNVSFCPQTYFNVSFVGRVNGLNSALTAGQPEGDIAVLVDFSNGQTVQVNIHQERYITQASTQPLPTALCRSSYYWPVVDPVGVSAPTAIYSLPASVSVGDSYQTIDFRNATLPTTASVPYQTSAASMCLLSDERVFGPTAWAYFSIDISQNPTATVEYVALYVDAAEVVPNPSNTFSMGGGRGSSMIIILLQGNSTAAGGRNAYLLDWQYYASFLQFRQIDSGSSTLLSYAFVPGTLLRAGSSKSVLINLQASLMMPSGSSTLIRYVIPVSQSFNAAVRGETVLSAYPSYTPPTSTSTSKLTIAYILALVLTVIVLVGVLVVRDAETRQAFYEEGAALVGCLTCQSDTAESHSKVEVVVPITTTSTVSASVEPTRVRKALTPAAAAAQAAKQAQRESALTAPSSVTPASPSSTRAKLAPLVPIEAEPPRVSHDD